MNILMLDEHTVVVEEAETPMIELAALAGLRGDPVPVRPRVRVRRRLSLLHRPTSGEPERCSRTSPGWMERPRLRTDARGDRLRRWPPRAAAAAASAAAAGGGGGFSGGGSSRSSGHTSAQTLIIILLLSGGLVLFMTRVFNPWYLRRQSRHLGSG